MTAGGASARPSPLPADGLVAVVQHGCYACERVLPELTAWADAGDGVRLVSQDAGYPPVGRVLADDNLAMSRWLGVTSTPALVRVAGGTVTDRVEGWDRDAWRRLSGRAELGDDLPVWIPGCTGKHIDPTEVTPQSPLQSRRIALGEREDVHEAAFERGWTDGLPVVPPTEARVAAMLAGTRRRPDEVVAIMPPSFAEVTVEKVAVNAVLAGCRPEYLPVVLAAVEAAGSDTFNIHGVAATTHFVGPVVIVNGPVAGAIGMNARGNAMGQGNRANATIGRALNLVIRNVGGARPGDVDRSTLGSPGKLTFCFAENEEHSPWESLARERGVPPGRSAVTLFAGVGPQPVVDQKSRTGASLAGSIAMSLRTVAHAKLAGTTDAIVVIAPEHASIFAAEGWDKARVRSEVLERLRLPVAELLPGVDGNEEGMRVTPDDRADATLDKFAAEGLWFVHAGSPAGQYTGIIAGWVNGPRGSQMTTVEVES